MMAVALSSEVIIGHMVLDITDKDSPLSIHMVHMGHPSCQLFAQHTNTASTMKTIQSYEQCIAPENCIYFWIVVGSHRGLAPHVCVVQKGSHFPSDTYMHRKSLYCFCIPMVTIEIVPGQDELRSNLHIYFAFEFSLCCTNAEMRKVLCILVKGINASLCLA